MAALADSPLFWLAVFGLIITGFFLPTLVAVIRGTDGLALVLLVNLTAASTGIGWLAAMILACGPRKHPPLPPPPCWPGVPERPADPFVPDPQYFVRAHEGPWPR
jgi:Superinfection immunity protein